MEESLQHFAEIKLQAAILEQSPNFCKLNCEVLAPEPLAFRRMCLTVLWKQQNWPRKRMTFAHWNDLAELLTQPRGGISLPAGLSALRRKHWLSLERQPK